MYTIATADLWVTVMVKHNRNDTLGKRRVIRSKEASINTGVTIDGCFTLRQTNTPRRIGVCPVALTQVIFSSSGVQHELNISPLHCKHTRISSGFQQQLDNSSALTHIPHLSRENLMIDSAVLITQHSSLPEFKENSMRANQI